MAALIFLKFAFVLLCAASLIMRFASAGDPDIITDFVLPPDATSVNSTYFTFTGLRPTITAPPPTNFTIFKASLKEFPSLEGQSVSMAVLMYPVGSVNPLHTHPRSAELLFLVQGNLEVGFVDTAGELYNQTLQQGDVFVFPKGLAHFQYACGKNPAVAISAFGSANAGTVSVPRTAFGTGIDDAVLAKSFKTDTNTVEKLKAGLQG